MQSHRRAPQLLCSFVITGLAISTSLAAALGCVDRALPFKRRTKLLSGAGF